ncbi:MAG: hypothetical protein KME18_20690 [Phormidium tanganyikae FI6-MK23]|jgi:hypothetical protein|nr:hypothetical protein [Phormidium tanganyikae FI6-MK23]
MPDLVYDWKRFWCARSSQFDLSDRGYLTNPGSEWGKYCNSELTSLESMVESQCLVLLGEPGIGKSQELKNLRNHTQTAVNALDKQLPLDLQAYSSETRLIRNLFESKTFIDWTNGTHRLHLFLDSLDEGLLKIDTLSMLLVEELSKEEYRGHLSRLYFRIACRTAVFPKSMEEGLNQLWKNNVKIYELVPLRRTDVRIAATESRIDADRFLEAVDRKGVVPFAIKPITLQFLINIFQRNNKQFPQRLTDLYLEGCRILCEEPKDQNYHPSRRASSTDVGQRLIIAARIAAVTIFARKSAVWTGSLSDVADEDILLERLCLGSERASQRSVDVTATIIGEVLDTGLFSSRGTNRMGWAHQSYPEFLAAWYLKQHNLSLDQILSLIIHPDGRVIPQLHETAAWLASLDTQTFQSVMTTDPNILLQSEILVSSDKEKAAVLDSLLALHDQGKLVYDFHLPEFSPYKRWNHAELSTQLRWYICNSTKSEVPRYVAIDIAEACNVQAVKNWLADVTLDPTEPYWLRARAAKAVKRLGDAETKLRLKPLAVSQADDDLEDELKGHALHALYPKHLAAVEVLDSITQPRARVIGGIYQDFLAKEFAKHLQVSDLPAVLTWLENQPVLHHSHYPFNALSDRILLKAWQHLEIRQVLEIFSKIVLLRIRAYQQVIDSLTGIEFIDLLAEDDSKRRCLLDAIINLVADSTEHLYYLSGASFYSRVTPLKQDFSWLIEKIQTSELESVQRTYAWLVRLKLDWTDADQLSLVIAASENFPVLKLEFAAFLGQIEINSSEAETARANYLREIDERRSWEDEKPEVKPFPKERVLTYLEQFELGQVEAWWLLCREMTLLPTSQYYGDDSQSDLTVLPGWREADDLTQMRIISAAKRYIYDGNPETDAWFGTNSFRYSARYSALAGYKALRLVLEKERQYVLDIPPEIWRKWTAIILDYPNSSDSRNKEHREPLLSLTYKNAPDEFVSRLIILLDWDNTQHGDIYISNQVDQLWNERLETALCRKLQDEKLTAKSIGSLLKQLLSKQSKPAKTFAQAQISSPPPIAGKAREIAIVAAQMLMLYTDDESWALVWNSIQHDFEYRKKVLEAVSFANEFQGSIEHRLCEDYIADLYIFLVKHYPEPQQKQGNIQNEDIRIEDYSISAEDSIRRWREQIPQRLQQRGTRGACEALRKIIHQLPEQKDKLQWRLPEAEASARRREWKPPQPEEILRLVANQEPSNLELYNQLGTIARRTQEMADEPKIDQSIHVMNSEISGVVGSGKIEHRSDPPPEKEANWKFWLPIAISLISIAVSGVFNDEIKKFFFKPNTAPQIEQKLEK